MSVILQGLPGGSVVENPPANVGDVDSIHELERSSGKGNGNPLQYSCLKNPMDRGAWWATVHRFAMSGIMIEHITVFSFVKSDNPITRRH